MGDARRGGAVPSVLIVLLLFTATLPSTQAESGAVLIDEASFGLVNGTTFFDPDLSFTLELHETMGQSANVSLEVRVLSLEGVLRSNQSIAVSELGASEQRNVSVTLTEMPVGYSQVVVDLEGDAGSNTTLQFHSLDRLVQRLRPLAISLSGPSSVVAQGVDSMGATTGNLTLHDGDRLHVEFPISNDGDVDWNGIVSIELMDANGLHFMNTSTVNVLATSSISVSFFPSISLTEGNLMWWVNLSGDLGEAGGVHALSGTFLVYPPPLPMMTGVLSSNADEVSAGQQLDFNLTIWNNGTVAFVGQVICTTNGQEMLNRTVNLVANATTTEPFSMIARPVTVSCGLTGSRVDATSTFPVSVSIEMPSAAFESAGSTAPSLNGGPWHKGDTMSANMLVRNIGELDGRARLVLNIDGIVSEGDWVELNSGSAGELSVSAQALSEGSTDVHWSIESDDGVVLGANAGLMTYAIRPQQSIQLSVSELTVDPNTGLSFQLGLTLDEGRARDVLVRLGYDTGDATVYLHEYTVELQPGLYEQQHEFGDISGEKLVASVEPVDWLIGPGPLMLSTNLPEETTQFWITFGQTTTPLRPVQSDDVKVELTFHQSGPTSEEVGEVWVVDTYGTLLAKVQSPSWWGEPSVSLLVDVAWPKGSTVGLQAIWYIDGTVLTEDASYTSGELPDSTSNEWPLAAIMWGLIVGVGAVLVGRVRFQSRSSSASSSSDGGSEPSSDQKSSDRSSDEKREISCPECDRRLRVPTDYEGSVGCPDCAHKFEVQPLDGSSSSFNIEDSEPETVAEEPQQADDGKMEIACPDCAQTLRIPSSYQGSVRCPACTIIFKATDGVTILE